MAHILQTATCAEWDMKLAAGECIGVCAASSVHSRVCTELP